MGLSIKNQRQTLTTKTKLNRNQVESAKQRIALTKLVDRLQGFALARPTDEDFESHMMTPAQVAANKTLIERLIPSTRHETIEQTTNITYTVSESVSDKINQLLNRANEKLIESKEAPCSLTTGLLENDEKEEDCVEILQEKSLAPQ